MATVDLNLWQLDYEDVSLQFGTHETGYPLTKQVVVGPVAVQTDDVAHPLSDGLAFGIDRARGRSIQFAAAHLDQTPREATRQWVKPLDSGNVFARAWRARSVRRTAGAVATLSNLDRERLVYGRPRNYAPTLDRVRQGWSEFACDFATVDDKFYALTENMVSAGPVPESIGGFTFETTFPMSTFGVVSADAPGMVVGGNEETWPVVIFEGPCNDPRVLVKDADDNVLFTIGLQATLESYDTVIVDCRPWRRGVTKNGVWANGLLRATTRLDECRLPPDEVCTLLTYGIVPELGATATLWWRDAFSDL